MNVKLWQQHLTDRNQQLEREIRRLRVLLTAERRRADTWRTRALIAATPRPSWKARWIASDDRYVCSQTGNGGEFSQAAPRLTR